MGGGLKRRFGADGDESTSRGAHTEASAQAQSSCANAAFCAIDPLNPRLGGPIVGPAKRPSLRQRGFAVPYEPYEAEPVEEAPVYEEPATSAEESAAVY